MNKKQPCRFGFFLLWIVWFWQSFWAGTKKWKWKASTGCLHKNRDVRALNPHAVVRWPGAEQLCSLGIAQQHHHHQTDNGSHRRRTLQSAAHLTHNKPIEPPRETPTAMGDRVALLLLAVLASALAAEVGLLSVLCENVALFFPSPSHIVVVVLRQASLS